MPTNFPNGITSYGMPVLAGAGAIPPTTGSVFFVHSGTGNNTTYAGTETARPFATIKYALTLCTASKGDIIIVMPGHAESIVGATTLDVNIAGVRIIGLGHGRNRPVLSFTNTAGKVVVSAANILISNVVFTADVSAVVTGVSVTASDVTFESCEWDMVDTGDDFAIMLLAATVSRLVVRNCSFLAEEIAGCNAAIQFNAVTGLIIEGCVFDGDYTTSILNGVTAASSRVGIHHNFLRNADTTAGLILTTFTATLGLASYNSAGTLYSTNITAPWVNTSVLSVENYIVNVVTETAGVNPAVVSA